MSIKKIYTKTIAILDILYVCSIFFYFFLKQHVIIKKKMEPGKSHGGCLNPKRKKFVRI